MQCDVNRVCVAVFTAPGDPPQNVTVQDIGADYLTIQCDPPTQPNGEIHQYHVFISVRFFFSVWIKKIENNKEVLLFKHSELYLSHLS